MLGAYENGSDSQIDKLTGLPTRPLFDKELESRVHDQPGAFGLLYVDADDLKITNDTHGHSAGDELLINIASTLEGTVRREVKGEDRELDYVGRNVFRLNKKGDEFAVLLAGVDTQEKVDAAKERLQKGFAEKGIRVSMGGQLHQPGQSAKEFLHAVDQRMYKEKAVRREAHRRELMASLPRRRALFFWSADKLMKMAGLEYKISGK